jgi:hypothetical protein
MKKIILLMLIFAGIADLAKTQTNKQFLDYFPTISKDSIIDTRPMMSLYYGIVDNNSFPDTIALKRFFNNNKRRMEYVEVDYNADDNIYIYTPLIKKVCPIYKIKYDSTHLVCYIIRSVVYLSLYDSLQDKFESSLIIANFADDFGNVYTHSTIFPNNYIAMVQVAEKSYYILLKIDYESKKFIEIKRVSINDGQSYNDIKHYVFNALGISEEGELLEENENSQETENKK